MNKKSLFVPLFFLFALTANAQTTSIAETEKYLSDIKNEMKKEWPGNKTINLDFHGHSVPSGYFKTPVVNTLESYPYLVLKELKKLYPFAVINVIITAIGGENSSRGAERFEKDVLIHKPDVLFIDYALNDRPLGLDKSEKAWESMIQKALESNIKVILLTPTPDQRVNILEPGNILEQHTNLIKKLAAKFNTGLADSYAIYKDLAQSGKNIADYMSQVNHPNEKGHQLIAEEIIKYFK